MKKIILFPFILSSLIIGQSYVLNFDGSNDYLSVAASDNASTKLTASSEFTISAWVFIEGENKQQIFYNDGAELEWLGSALNLFRMQPGSVPSVSNLHRNQWHHVVMTRNSSNSIQIYVNANLSQNYVSNSDGADDIFYVGRDPNQGEYFDGSMDEIAIWSTELSAAQITTLYNKGVPESATNISGAASSLQSYWKLEQSTGTTAANSVTNGAALTLNNGPTWGKFKQSPVPDIMYNIRTGSQSAYPDDFIEYNGKIYFKADDGSKGSEMWVFDPANDASSTNPTRISDIRSGSGSGISWTDHWLVWNNKLYFVGNDGSYGDELYSYDGSSFTRVADIYTGGTNNGSRPNFLTIYNDKLYFSAYTSTYNTELWVYDGTNVSLVKDLAPTNTTTNVNPAGFGWGGMAVYNNKLYFQGYTESTGYELYSYDGTDISLVKDINSGTYTSGSATYPNSSSPSEFTVFDNKLFFKATDATIGSELFYYDGTNVTGIDIYTGSTTSGSSTYLNNGYPYGIIVFRDTLYFEANSTYNWELFGYDATKGVRLIKDIAPGSENGGHPHNITAFDNKLYFSGEDGYNVTGSAGTELWYYDGDNVGRAADINAVTGSSSYPYAFFATADKMYFRAQESSTGAEPYILTSLDPFPSIASVTSTTSNDTYKTGDAINITVNFSEAVSLSSGGSMTVTLETGSTDRTVSITSISSATSASGTYTVQAGDESSDLTVKSITVSGTISDATDQAMVDFSIGSNLASSSAIVVDGVAPTVASVKSTSTNTTYGTGATINITVNFSEKVILSSGGSMTVTLETGSTDRTVSITSISNDTTASGTYTVQDGDGSSDLNVNSIALASGSLTDAAGNAMSSFAIPSGSNLSDNNAIVINTSKPSTPTGFVVSSNYGSVGLAWTAVSGATGYKVYRSTSATSDFASVATPSTNSYSESPSTVTRYYYYVMSVNNLGDSSPSDTLYGYPSEIWYVEMGGSDSNDGKSKAKAFATIEKAVKNNTSLVTGDTIYVGPSISSSKSRDDVGGYYDFVGISGGISVPYGKDFVLIGTSGADSTIFNAKHGNRHFNIDDGPSEATKIIGITFYKGKRSSGYGGGSIMIRGSGAKLEFINCVFEDNRIVVSDNQNWPGGAIEIRDQAKPSFTGCTFKNNYVENSEQGTSGGAIYINWSNNQSDLENTINFKQCKFIGNYAKGKQHTRGGAVLSYRNTLFENCLFVKNGAIAGYGQSSSTYESAYGGAIYSDGEQGSIGITTVIANSTFDSNYVEVLTTSGWTKGTDIFYGQSSGNNATKYAYVFNSVITGSYQKGGGESNSDAEYKKDKVFYTDNTSNRIYVDYSSIEGSSGISWAANENVFDITPVYKNAANLDYSLSNLSPVIGKGTSTYKSVYNAPSIDILGAVRPSPSGSSPDMGAYENSLASSTAPLPITSLVGTAKTNSASLSWSAIKSSLGGQRECCKYQIPGLSRWITGGNINFHQ